LDPATPPPDIPPAAEQPPESATPRRGWFRVFGLSHKHTAASATLLLSVFALLSRIIGLLRDKYIAYTFGAGPQTDAYNIAFNLPDLVAYLLIGGAASISFVTILSRYREQGRDEEGEIALSVILNTMVLVLGGALLIAEFLAPLYIRIYSRHDPVQDALAVYMTRILLPGQLFFFAGGVLASVALVRKQFGYQAVSPLVYSTGIIIGGVLGARWLGIPSLAWGALAGAFCGPFLVNAVAARRAGIRWRPVRAWVRMSIPMMLGVTVVTLDNQILQFFAKHETGDITRLMNAKKLFTAPMAIIGQAAGAASLPFFASLYSANRMEEFRGAVGRSVTRIACVALLLASLMVALSSPICDLVLRGGHYTRADSARTAMFLAIFSISLALWSAQAIYIRAFFAAGQTLPPMLAGTIITVVSLPVYWALHARFGAMGLAWASNLAILAHTAAVAILLHVRKLMPMARVDRRELTKSLAAAVVSAIVIVALLRLMPARTGHVWNAILLLAGTCIWGAVCWIVLRVTRSSLPAELLRRARA
jgi:putative peptidoglycan lipid II flippase